jgi:hypothetical protein
MAQVDAHFGPFADNTNLDARHGFAVNIPQAQK